MKIKASNKRDYGKEIRQNRKVLINTDVSFLDSRLEKTLAEEFEISLEEIKADIEQSNPMRYPKHNDPRKGQVYKGECNRTACHNLHAIWWNMGTYGLYCTECAIGINCPTGNNSSPICVKVKSKPLVEEHETFKHQNGYYSYLEKL